MRSKTLHEDEIHEMQPTTIAQRMVTMDDEGTVRINMPKVDATQIVVKNLTYSVENVKHAFHWRRLHRTKTVTHKTILDDLNMVFKPGRLSVIIGPSGSGKTSLLSLIAGVARNVAASKAKVDGRILFNGMEMSASEIRRLVGFVFQDDILLPTMTVREAIEMSVILRLPNMSARERNQVIQRMLQITQLEKVADTRVGDSLRKGISGGERKRAAISMELVSNPSVLLLDEPTSGLDSFTAFRIVSLLKRLAQNHGRTIIATLHQPSSELFKIIDDLVILWEGKVVFAGPADIMVQYFDDVGYRFEPDANPADTVMMGVINRYQEDEFYEDSYAPLVRYDDAMDVVELPKHYSGTNTFVDYQKRFVDEPEDVGIHKGMYRYSAKFGTTFMYLINRDLRNAHRNPMVIRVKLYQTLFMAVFIALIFQKASNAPAPAVYQNLAGVLFFLVTNAFFASFNNTLTVFGSEKAVFFREYAQGYYGVTPYYIAKVFVELPLTVCFPIITALITYWVVGFRGGFVHWIVFTVSLMLIALAAFGFAMLVGCYFNDINVALAFSILVILPLFVTSGLLVNIATVPVYLRWIQWISPMKYGYTAMLTDQFSGWGAGFDEYLMTSGVTNGFSIWLNWIMTAVIGLTCLFLGYLALLRHVVKKEGWHSFARSLRSKL